jgi:SPP1 family phage portal protein
MYIFTMPADEWDEMNPNRAGIQRLIEKHYSIASDRLIKLKKYYEGDHEILHEKDRANKLVCNHAKEISDAAFSYFLGNPIAYKDVSGSDLTPLTDALRLADADETDGDNGLSESIFGVTYEYIYTKKDDTVLVTKNLSPIHTFMVYDDTIEQNELFAVYYYVRKDDTNVQVDHYIATVLTQNYKWVFDIQKMPGDVSVVSGPEPHFKGEVPVIEYLNNRLGIGDFELQIPLIDAYDALMSDRVTDKEQFIDAILALYGTLLGDDSDADENGETSHDKAVKDLHAKKILELPSDAKAEYLTRTFDESGVEILKKAIEQDIHKFSQIPCMTDENFAGNTSGVAMEFKLLGIENITKIKTRYYRRGLRKRIRIFCNWMKLNSAGNIDPKRVTAVFTRALPKNNLEISQMVANLKGTVSTKTLLAQIPFVDDPDEEIAAVDEENQKALERQQAMFANSAPPDEGGGENDQATNPDQEGNNTGQPDDKKSSGEEEKTRAKDLHEDKTKGKSSGKSEA